MCCARTFFIFKMIFLYIDHTWYFNTFTFRFLEVLGGFLVRFEIHRKRGLQLLSHFVCFKMNCMSTCTRLFPLLVIFTFYILSQNILMCCQVLEFLSQVIFGVNFMKNFFRKSKKNFLTRQIYIPYC